MTTRAPCGTWHSPISAADLARSAISLDDLQVVDGAPYWVESRPAESGRYVIVTPAAADIDERTPAGFNARTRVHEYGGRAYTAARGGTIFFSHFADQRVYVQQPHAAPISVTPAGYRYADFALDCAATRLFCVREDHTADGEPTNAIVALDVSRYTRLAPTDAALTAAADATPAAAADTAPRTTAADAAPSAGTILFGAADFAAYPRPSPDGRRLAWIAWNHPDMPWDATTLHVGELTPQGLAHVTRVAGGPGESVLEPRWDTDGSLYFISDRSGWWNLYRFREGHVEAVLALEADLAGPLWTLGDSTYALTGDGRAVIRYTINACDHFGVVALGSGTPPQTVSGRDAQSDGAPSGLRRLDLPFVSLSNVELLSPSTAIAVASSATAEPAVVTIDLATGAHRVLRAPGTLQVDPRYFSIAEPVEYPTAGGRTAHGFFYPPRSAEYLSLEGEKPPLVVKAHGGPTAHSGPALSLATQFWTSRGFAVLDVNYGGSSGYGRAYRERLNGNWGVVDVADVVAGVKYLVSTAQVDGARTAIRGGSAGGFTVLAALAFHDAFRAGADYYGVSDLEALTRDTHKFESRYLDRLVAPLPAGKPIYEARAPIRHLESFRAPLIVFQGAEDAVVPPSQSRAIVEALERKGVPVVYVELEGEQHGFRRAESIVRTLEAELAFYGQVFGFTPAGA